MCQKTNECRSFIGSCLLCLPFGHKGTHPHCAKLGSHLLEDGQVVFCGRRSDERSRNYLSNRPRFHANEIFCIRTHSKGELIHRQLQPKRLVAAE